MYACMRACVVACVSCVCVCVCVCVCGNVSARHDPTLRTHTRTHMTSARQSPRASVMLPTASQHNPESLNPRDTTAPSCTMHLERNTRHRHPAPCSLHATRGSRYRRRRARRAPCTHCANKYRFRNICTGIPGVGPRIQSHLLRRRRDRRSWLGPLPAPRHASRRVGTARRPTAAAQHHRAR